MMRLRSFFSPSWGSLGPRSLDTMICIGGATSQWSWQSLMQAIGHGTPIDMISSYCNSAKTTSTWTFLYVPLISGTQHQHNLTLIKIIKCARSNIMIASDVLKFGSNMCHKRCCAHGADIPNLPNHITQYENHALMPKSYNIWIYMIASAFHSAVACFMLIDLASCFTSCLRVHLSRVSISSGSSWRVAEAKALKASTSLVTKAVAMLRRGRVELQAAPQWIKLAFVIKFAKSFLSKVVSQLKYSEKTTAYNIVLRSINNFDIESCRLESNHT